MINAPDLPAAVEPDGCPVLKNLTVLLVDDDFTFANRLGKVLGDRGLDVCAAPPLRRRRPLFKSAASTW